MKQAGLKANTSVDSHMNLALTVAENVMGGRSPSLRRVSVKPAVEEKGMFRKKKQSESMMVFSFSADEVAGEGSCFFNLFK